MSEHEVADEAKRDCLLADYREAGEDARYRDRLLYNSYYLAIVLLVFVIQALATLIANGLRIIASIVLFGSGLLYLFLTAWAVGVKRSRDNAWERRENIEEKFGDDLRTNEYAALNAGSNRNAEKKGLGAAYEHALRNPSLTEIPKIVRLADINFLTWLLIPTAILSFILSVAVLFGGTIVESIEFWSDLMAVAI